MVEILVVLAVLISLAGIGLAAAQGARQVAQAQRVRVELDRVAAAIEGSALHFGRFPDSTDPAVLYGILAGRLGPDGRPLGSPGRRFLEPAGFRLVLDAEDDPANHLIDPWGKAYHYRWLDPAPGGGPAGFDLYSGGPDGDPAETGAAAADNLHVLR